MKRTKYLFLSAILVLAVGCSPKKAGTIGADASVESRVEALLGRMTLAEKIGQSLRRR